MRRVVIYSGRFQPMLRHHVQVYHDIQKRFPSADVFFAATDVVESKDFSPFTFDEKVEIARVHGIPPEKMLYVKRPYNANEFVKYFDMDSTEAFFAVGEKDQGRLFQPDHTFDSRTGLYMLVRQPNKARYFQSIDTYENDPMPMSKRGYVVYMPNVMSVLDKEQVADVTAFKKELAMAPDEEYAKKLFVKEFGKFDNDIFELIYRRIKSVTQKTMESERIRVLSGLKPRKMLMEETPPVDMVDDDNTGEEKEFDMLGFDSNAVNVDIADLNVEKLSFVAPTEKSRVPSNGLYFQVPERDRKNMNDISVKREIFKKAIHAFPFLLLDEIIGSIAKGRNINNHLIYDAMNRIYGKMDDIHNTDERSKYGGRTDAEGFDWGRVDDKEVEFINKVLNAALERMEFCTKERREDEKNEREKRKQKERENSQQDDREDSYKQEKDEDDDDDEFYKSHDKEEDRKNKYDIPDEEEDEDEDEFMRENFDLTSVRESFGVRDISNEDIENVIRMIANNELPEKEISAIERALHSYNRRSGFDRRGREIYRREKFRWDE